MLNHLIRVSCLYAWYEALPSKLICQYLFKILQREDYLLLKNE